MLSSSDVVIVVNLLKYVFHDKYVAINSNRQVQAFSNSQAGTYITVWTAFTHSREEYNAITWLFTENTPSAILYRLNTKPDI